MTKKNSELGTLLNHNTYLWFIKDRPSGKSSPQTSQVTALLRCESMWRFNLALLWKGLAHFEQENCFSFECSQECLSKVRLSLHVRPHNMQVFGGRFLLCFCCTWAATAWSSAATSPQIMHLFIMILSELIKPKFSQIKQIVSNI